MKSGKDHEHFSLSDAPCGASGVFVGKTPTAVRMSVYIPQSTLSVYLTPAEARQVAQALIRATDVDEAVQTVVDQPAVA